MSHFLIDPVLDAEATLDLLHEFKVNSFRKTYTNNEFEEKEKYIVATVGNQGCGKSTLLNTLLAAFTRQNYFEKAKVGTKTAPGTRCFDGPHYFLTPKRIELFQFYDGMGFDLTPSDPQSSLLIKNELIDIANGDIKPGFVRYGNNGAFEQKPDEAFTGVDLMLIVARFTDEEEVKAALKMKTMMDINFIPSYLVLTHAGEDKSHKMLKGIPHSCFELEYVAQFTPTGQELTRSSIELLKQIVLILETSKRGQPRTDCTFKYQQLKEKVSLKTANSSLWIIILVLIMSLITAIGTKMLLLTNENEK